MNWRLGTMGYSYRDWAGPFYPPRHAPRDWLRFYSRQFNAVELNNTFHAVPAPMTVQSWAASVGPEFRFSVKANRAITHDLALPRARVEFDRFLEVMRLLGRSLGPILLQYPPSFRAREFDGFKEFIERLPTDLRFAIEFRHHSWLIPRVYDLLAEARMALVAIDHDDHPQLAVVEPTTDFLYIRLIGKHDRYNELNYERFDPTEKLKSWLAKLRSERHADVKETWVLFNNEYAGYAPATLKRFAVLAGVELPEAQNQPLLFDM